MAKCVKLVSGLNTKQEVWLGDADESRCKTETEEGFKMWKTHGKALSKTALEFLKRGADAGSLECKRLVEIAGRLGLEDFSKFSLPGVLHGKPMDRVLRNDLEEAMVIHYRKKHSGRPVHGYALSDMSVEKSIPGEVRRQMMREVVMANPGKYAVLVENEWIGAPWLRWTPGANAAHELEHGAANRMVGYCKDLGDLMSKIPKARAEAKAAGVAIPAWCLEAPAVGFTSLGFARLAKLELFLEEPVEVLAGVKSKALYAERVGADGQTVELGFYNKRGDFSKAPSDAALFESHGAAMSSARQVWRKHGHVLLAVVDVRVAVVGCQSAMAPAVSHDRLMAAIAAREKAEMMEYAEKLDAARLVEKLASVEAENKLLREKLGMEVAKEKQAEPSKRRL